MLQIFRSVTRACQNETMPRTGLTPSEIKERAIELAEARIRQHGVDKVRLVDIAGDLSVSHVALYKHFPDKASLIDAVSEKWLEEVDRELTRVAQGPEPIGERIRIWFLAYHRLKVRKVRNDPEPYKAFDMAADAMKPFIVRHLETIFSLTVGLVSEGMEAGILRPGEPAATATLMLEMTVAFHHPKLVSERLEEDREASLLAVVDVMLRGLS